MYDIFGRTDQPWGAAAPQGVAIQHRGRKQHRRLALKCYYAVIPMVTYPVFVLL